MKTTNEKIVDSCIDLSTRERSISLSDQNGENLCVNDNLRPSTSSTLSVGEEHNGEQFHLNRNFGSSTSATWSIDEEQNGAIICSDDHLGPSTSATWTIDEEQNGVDVHLDDNLGPLTSETWSASQEQNVETLDANELRGSLFSINEEPNGESQLNNNSYRLSPRNGFSNQESSTDNFWSQLLGESSEASLSTQNSENQRSSASNDDLLANDDVPLKKRRKSYTTGDKLRYIEEIRKNNYSINKAAKIFQIPRKNIQRWISQESALKTVRDDHDETVRLRRKIPRKRVPKFQDIEKKLLERFYERRCSGLRVSADWLKKNSMDIALELNIQNFCASNGYISRFLSRNLITLRNGTSVGQKLPQDAKRLACNFIGHFETLRQRYNGCDILYANMDEVPVWIDMPANHTYERRGETSVKLSSTGQEKTRFTVVLATLSNGLKLRPMIIFKGRDGRAEEYIGNVFVTYSKGGSMNDELMQRWLKKCWKTRPNNIIDNLDHSASKRRTVLVMDSFPCHKKENFIEDLDRFYNTSTAIIPGGLTKVLQPADVSYNKTFKTEMRRCWEDWMENGRKEFTNKGNRKHANGSELANWVETAWDAVPDRIIQKSFDCCGITDAESSELNHKLMELLTDGPVDLDVESRSGLTDNEEQERLFDFLG